MFGEVAQRYARALLEVAVDHNEDLRELETGLSTFVEVLGSDAALRRALSSPATSRASRAVLAEALGRRIAAGTRLPRFAALMVSKDRVDAIPDTARAFSALIDEREGVVVGEVTSARPLDAAARARLAGALGEALGGTARLSWREDPELLGGLVLRTGNRIYDASLKRELERFTEDARGRR